MDYVELIVKRLRTEFQYYHDLIDPKDERLLSFLKGRVAKKGSYGELYEEVKKALDEYIKVA